MQVQSAKVELETISESKECKYCQQKLELCVDEGLECTVCKQNIHLRCLRRGSVPGGLCGDVFYDIICRECSPEELETFVRIKISWLQIICLVLYHLQMKSPGLARKGFFHWRHHISTFIDQKWEVIFPPDVKKKKKWMGTIAGTLSHFSGYIFLSGTSVFREPAWWTLYHPKLTPQAISYVYAKLLLQKQMLKMSHKKIPSDAEVYENTLLSCIQKKDCLQPFTICNVQLPSEDTHKPIILSPMSEDIKKVSRLKRKSRFSSLSNTKRLLKISSSLSLSGDLTKDFNIADVESDSLDPSLTDNKEKSKPNEFIRLFDPYCHFNTSLSSISRLKGLSLQAKLTGGIKQDLILSPYSQIYLKPYIRRDTETFPPFLKLMAELQFVANCKNEDYVLPSRAPIDYTYVQPEHIPAINSMCNKYFWPGIDLAETLQYPDFSCVVLYKRLIIGFAFLVPNVKHTEHYLSFIFTRPFWRNCGIAKFMVYHLIQTSLGKDITLHVSINNSALFLYQKFGFKVENVVLDFYDKYYRTDVNDSKHAFFCRLER